MIHSVFRLAGFACAGIMIFTSSVLAMTGEVSFTPTGFKFPIMKITIAKNEGSVGTAISASHEQTVFKCASTTEANCLVDLGDQAALDAISAAATGVSVEVGTYDLLTLYSCADGKGGSDHVSVWLKGGFTVSSTPFYTDPADSNGVNSTSTSADFTEITNWGCSTKAIILASPLIVGDPSGLPSPTPSSSPVPTTSLTQTLTVLVDNSFLAYSTPHTSAGMGGCKVSGAGGVRGVCVNIPALLPYVGTASTSTLRFKVAHKHANATFSAGDDTLANALVIVPRAGTTPLTVFGGRFYSETSAEASNNVPPAPDTAYGGPTYVTSTDIASFKDNGDQTVQFQQGASADTYAGIFSAFPLAGGIGTATTPSGDSWHYHAIPF